MAFIGNSSIRFEDYEIDRVRWQLSWRNEPIPLARKTFDLLLYLVDHADRVVPKDELLQTLWPGSFVEESNLSQHIFLLRKALSRHESGEKLIETIPGRGYRFAATIQLDTPPANDRMVISASKSITRITLEEEEVDPPVPASQLGTSRPALSAPSRQRRGYSIGGAILAAAAALAVAGWFGAQRWLNHSSGPPIDVVLTPMDGSTGDHILDGALVDALRMDLTQSPFVSVVSPARVRVTLAEMKHKPDDTLTPDVSREVCERTNSQAVLHGSIARLGQHFLLTEQATSCVNGAVLAESKREAANAEDLPGSIDKLAESLRQKLGESRRSIAHFDTPLFSGRTASLEALKNLSQAEQLSNEGKYLDAIGLMKKAIAADPGFADAYYDLATFYKNTRDPTAEQDALLKAYNLRDSASEPVRLAIVALYLSDTTQDLYEAERNFRNWTELYPRSPVAWNGLSSVERELGHHAEGLIAAMQALQLRPMIAGLYVNVAFEQRRTGDAKGSIATCEAAIARGLDGDTVRAELFISAYVLHDAVLVQQQTEWAAAHPEAYSMQLEEIAIALTEGRFSDVHQSVQQLVASLRNHGQADFADDVLREVSLDLFVMGDEIEGARLFHSVPVDPQNQLSVLGLVNAGDIASAETALHAMQIKLPQGTIWNDFRAPEVQAMIAMASHQPKDAIAALERTRPLDGRNQITTLLRADAYLAAGEPALAEKSYRWIINGPFLNSEAGEYPLSWLGLGRALAAEGNRPGALDAYQHFFTLWAHADPDAIFLLQAKQEFATLNQSRP
jgi:DNA-binding winged helix-turn-helix (wHTH) protein/tetratricopeptide (TPR) repeat protein